MHCTQAFPLRGRWHGEAVTDEVSPRSGVTAVRIRPKQRSRKPSAAHLISQKSKIFDSFPQGEALGRSRASAFSNLHVSVY